MVRQVGPRVVFYILTALLTLRMTCCDAYAQYSNASVAFVPFGASTHWGAPAQRAAAAFPGSSGAPIPALVARRTADCCDAIQQNRWTADKNSTTSRQFCGIQPGQVVGDQVGSVRFGCGDEAAGCGRARPAALWYASAAGLYLGRDKGRRVWTSYENNNNANQLMNTADADPDWQAGADLRLGRSFACSPWALELGYWSINNFVATASQTHLNDVSTPLQFNDLEFAVGDPVVDYFDSAAEHRLHRENELHNVEINLINMGFSATGCGPWSHQMLIGVRYFKFDEDFTFATLDQGGTWGGNGGLDEVTLTDSIKNDLVGLQIGCLFQRQLGCRTRLQLTPKFGIYNNHIDHQFDLRRGDGTAALPSAFSGVPGSYPVESNTDVVAFLSEASVGLQYQACCRWTLSGGYRVVVLNNVGLADDQIPQYIVDLPEIAGIDTHGSLVLQGAYFGAIRSF